MNRKSDDYDLPTTCVEISGVGCLNEAPLLYIYMSNAIWAAVVGLIGFGVLWHRVYVKKFRILDYNSPLPFIIRPKPIESMLLFGSLSSIFDAINCMINIVDSDPFRTAPTTILSIFFAHVPWQFGICSFSCYLFGVAHTVCNSNQLIGRNWYKMAMRIDIICTIFIILPFITTNISSIAAAVSVLQWNAKAARVFAGVLYYQWLVYWSILAIMIFIAGLRLIKILEEHLRNQIEAGNGAHVQKIRNGLFKVRMTMVVSISSMLLFVFIRYFYDLMRKYFEGDYGITLGFSTVLIYHRTIASTLVVITVLLNPSALGAFSVSSNQEALHEPKVDAHTNFAVRTDEVTLIASDIENGKDSYDLHRQSLDHLSQDRKNYKCASADKMI